MTYRQFVAWRKRGNSLRGYRIGMTVPQPWCLFSTNYVRVSTIVFLCGSTRFAIDIVTQGRYVVNQPRN
jgi:hypothetical protein